VAAIVSNWTISRFAAMRQKRELSICAGLAQMQADIDASWNSFFNESELQSEVKQPLVLRVLSHTKAQSRMELCPHQQ
jgi:hypothetical protein